MLQQNKFTDDSSSRVLSNPPIRWELVAPLSHTVTKFLFDVASERGHALESRPGDQDVLILKTTKSESKSKIIYLLRRRRRPLDYSP